MDGVPRILGTVVANLLPHGPNDGKPSLTLFEDKTVNAKHKIGGCEHESRIIPFSQKKSAVKQKHPSRDGLA